MPLSLYVKSFDSAISDADKEDLLKYFGAVSVRHLRFRGKNKAVVAGFSSEIDCAYALQKLHQEKVFGHRLCVTYHDEILPKKQSFSSACENGIPKDAELEKISINDKVKEYEMQLAALSSQFDLKHPIPPNLRYLYPSISPSVLVNISQVLLTVPKFYTQVLHLMNKMNLPSPFSNTETCGNLESLDILRLFQEPKSNSSERKSDDLVILKPGNLDTDLEPDDLSAKSLSESESELESDQELNQIQRELPLKRIHISKKPKSKRLKLSLLKLPLTLLSLSKPSTATSLNEVFDVVQSTDTKKLEVKLMTKDRIVNVEKSNFQSVSDDTNSSGFGKLNSMVTPMDADANHLKHKSQFITLEEIHNNRVKESEWILLPVFKNYKCGEPSCKLYIKNLAKTTTEETLKYIFGRYIFWQNDEEVEMFKIQLFKEGRLKGQAFITFPSVEASTRALRDTNGFILNDKVMVVSYGIVKN